MTTIRVGTKVDRRAQIFAVLAFAALPGVAPAQKIIARPTVLIARPQLIVAREPSLYVFDHYTFNNRDYLLHCMDDLTGKAHSSEPFSGGIQGLGADRQGRVYAASS